MTLGERVPGMRPGRTVRNGGLALLYLSALPLLLVAGPAIAAVAVGRNYRNAATRLAVLPGISPDSGFRSAFVVFVAGYVLLGAVFGPASEPAADDAAPSGVAPATATVSGQSEAVAATTVPDGVSTTTAPTATPGTTESTSTATPTATAAVTTEGPATASATRSTTTDRPTTTATPRPTTTTTTPTTTAAGELVVARVQEDAPDNDHENENGEYVVFENVGGSPLDLSGWRVEDEAGHAYRFPGGFTLGPGETVTLYTGSGTDSDSSLYWGSDAAVWNNSGDVVLVFDERGERVVVHEYP